MTKIDRLAERIRREPYNPLTNNCVTKAFKLKTRCKILGIPARVVIALGYARTNKWFNHRLIVPAMHAWCDIKGERIDVARPLDEPGLLGVPPGDIKPIIGIWI